LEEIVLHSNKKIYFASDFHLGAPNPQKSLVREKIICQWLDEIKTDAQVIFLVGDLFDFWFEHKKVMPKGYSRFFGKLAELSDMGIKLIVFQGNHDMWMKDYLAKEFNAEIYREPKEYLISGKRMYIGHGDGLGPGDYNYKFLKRFFESSVCRWMFGNLIHPDLSLYLGYKWANHSWSKHDKELQEDTFASKEKELLYLYSLEEEKKQHRDYYIFGHRHLKLDIPLSTTSRYINLGDWIRFFSYAVFDGKELELKDYEIKKQD
jgi:UDP-2,3-diacylglucosamine hydrolase